MATHSSDRLRLHPARVLTIALLTCPTITSPASAQVLQGELLEFGTGIPVVGGLVALIDEGGETVASTSTDQTGKFTLSPGRAGRYSVYAEGLGYFTSVDGPLDLVSGEVTVAQFHLERNPIALDPLDVSAEPTNRWLELAGFYERKELNRGRFIERAEIEERNPRLMTDLFRSGTSFRVIPVQVAGSTGGYTIVSRRNVTFQNRGHCGPMVYLDGMRVGRTFGSGETPLDQLLYPEDVEAIEAYSSISQVPERWRDSSAACGVILIWTRKGL